MLLRCFPHCPALPCPASTAAGFRRRFVFPAGLLIGLIVAYGTTASTEIHGQQSSGKKAEIQLDSSSGASLFVVVNLPESALKVLQDAAADRAKMAPHFAVYVLTSAAGESTKTRQQSTQIPISGTYRIRHQRLWFTPRYPLRPGTGYLAVLDTRGLAIPKTQRLKIQRQFHIKRTPTPAANVVGVFPTSSTLPENQLKFYLYFSAPMSRGEVYQRIRLTRDDGFVVKYPFLEIEQELWDRSGTRLTLLFDPGRVKRGLKPREEDGPILEEGRSYRFTIDSAWLDANGQPLEKSYEKRFKASAPDDVQPDPKKWKIDAPDAGGRDALIVEFGEPLDHAMLHRVLHVTGDGGDEVVGKVTVDHGERRWSFRPTKVWQARSYLLVVDTDLEDRSGNSIERPFEVDVFKKVDRKPTQRVLRMPFSVRAKDRNP